MAVRRQLGLYFQEPQVGGVITVERRRTGFGAGICHQQGQPQSSKKTPESPPEDKVLSARGIQLEDCLLLFQCRGCHTVLGDSLHVCALEEKLRLFVLFKVTSEVVVVDKLMVSVEGELIGCTYNTLCCRSCERNIGLRLYSSKSLAYLRGYFCLFKDSITCYSLKTKTVEVSTEEASRMICPLVSLKDRIQKLKENLVLMHIRIDKLLKKIELSQQKIAMEKQSHKARPHAQTLGGTKRKLNN